MSGRLVAMLALAAIAAAGCAAVSESTTTIAAGGRERTGDAKRGALVYSTNCAVCHGAGGVGGVIGPSLYDERSRLDYQSLVSWIQDAQAPMPVFYPKILNTQQVLDVASYVDHL